MGEGPRPRLPCPALQPFSTDDSDGRAWTLPPPPPPRKRRRWLWGCLPALVVGVVLLIVAALLVARQQDGAIDRSPDGTVLPPNTVTTPVPGSTAVTSSCAITQGLITRECAVILPPGLPEGTKLPVVFLLHGLGDGPGTIRDAGAWTDAVLARRFMLVTPSGIASSWNAGDCCGIAKGTGIDDTSYLATLVEEIARRPDVETSRMYMAGFSNGGMMAYRFACVSDRLAGIASVSGTRVINCPPRQPLSILHIHGTADDTVPYQGGAGLVAAIMGVSFQPVPTMAEQVAADDGCTAPPSDRTDGDLTYEEWNGCGGGSRVELITIANWGHLWPLTGSLDATDEILSFFGIS